jgi:hypothetical protein
MTIKALEVATSAAKSATNIAEKWLIKTKLTGESSVIRRVVTQEEGLALLKQSSKNLVGDRPRPFTIGEQAQIDAGKWKVTTDGVIQVGQKKLTKQANSALIKTIRNTAKERFVQGGESLSEFNVKVKVNIKNKALPNDSGTIKEFTINRASPLAVESMQHKIIQKFGANLSIENINDLRDIKVAFYNKGSAAMNNALLFNKIHYISNVTIEDMEIDNNFLIQTFNKKLGVPNSNIDPLITPLTASVATLKQRINLDNPITEKNSERFLSIIDENRA